MFWLSRWCFKSFTLRFLSLEEITWFPFIKLVFSPNCSMKKYDNWSKNFVIVRIRETFFLSLPPSTSDLPLVTLSCVQWFNILSISPGDIMSFVSRAPESLFREGSCISLEFKTGILTKIFCKGFLRPECPCYESSLTSVFVSQCLGLMVVKQSLWGRWEWCEAQVSYFV